MVSEEIERLLILSQNDLQNFVKYYAKKYHKLFKNGYSKDVLHPTLQPFFPYEVTLEIKEQKS